MASATLPETVVLVMPDGEQAPFRLSVPEKGITAIEGPCPRCYMTLRRSMPHTQALAKARHTFRVPSLHFRIDQHARVTVNSGYHPRHVGCCETTLDRNYWSVV